jgi:hypothetical protein
MIDLGRYLLGDKVPLILSTITSDVVPAAPTAAPTARIYKNAATATTAVISIPIKAKGKATGLFAHDLFLSSTYSVGIWFVLLKWTVSAVVYKQLYRFEIVTGGDADGPPVALKYFDQRGADHLFWQTEALTVQWGTTPRI